MSVVGRPAKSHPQQVNPHRSGNDRRWHPDVEQDDRAITFEDFGPLHARFRFTVDAAAAAHNARLPRYWTRGDDGLAQSWAGERVWCNPPYSDIGVWIEKAWSEWRAEPGADCIVLLLPANRTEQRWWQKLVEPDRRRGHLMVEFLPGRMRFLRPGRDEIGPNERPPFGCCLVIWQRSRRRG